MDIEPFIQVDGGKLKKLSAFVWCPEEIILLAVPADINVKTKFHSGYVMITHGGCTLFRSKTFGTIDALVEFHFLNIRHLQIVGDVAEVHLEKHHLYIKSKYALQVINMLLRVLSQNIFGVPDTKYPSIKTDAPLEAWECTERPYNALINRCIFLSHFYKIEGEQLSAINYFEKWEEDFESGMLSLGHSFHPGNFAKAIGHAIAWEHSVNVVTFQQFNPTKFSKLFGSLICEATNVKTIAFCNYFKEEMIPEFKERKLPSISVSHWIFLQCLGLLVDCIMPFLLSLPKDSIKRIEFRHVKGLKFVSFVNDIETARSFRKLRTFCLEWSHFKKFPYKSLNRLVGFSPCLRELCIRGMSLDASHLLHKNLHTTTPLTVVRLNKLKFRCLFPEKGINLPPTLICLDVSSCNFTIKTFKSFWNAILIRPAQTPFVLEMENLVIPRKAWSVLETLNFDALQPNLVEINISTNSIPGKVARFFFALLFTQRRLIQITAFNMNPENPQIFFQFFFQLLQTLPVTGIDFSATSIPQDLMLSYIQFLQTMPQLRRLGLQYAKAGDPGAIALSELVESLKDLRQISADGMNCETEDGLKTLWRAIGTHPTIVEADRPISDSKKLGIKKPTGDLLTVFEFLSDKSSPSNTKQRVTRLMSKIEENPNELETYASNPEMMYEHDDVVLLDYGFGSNLGYKEEEEEVVEYEEEDVPDDDDDDN